MLKKGKLVYTHVYFYCRRFIADSFGVLKLNTSNQLLIIGTNTNGITWDDVAPLSGSGAASY